MAITTSALDPYDPRNMLSGSIGQVDRTKELYDRMQRLELAAQQQAATFNPDKYTINLGRPLTVIHRLGNGLLVTDLGDHDGQRMNHMFFASPLDFANHLIAVAAKRELDK